MEVASKSRVDDRPITVVQGQSKQEVRFNAEVRLTNGHFLWVRAGRNAIQSFLNDLRGVSSVEYALIVVAIIAIVGVGAGLLGDAFEGMFSDLSDRMSAAPAAVSSQAGT